MGEFRDNNVTMGASRGVAGAGLGLGIAGTALGVLNSGGLLGGLFGRNGGNIFANGCSYNAELADIKYKLSNFKR